MSEFSKFCQLIEDPETGDLILDLGPEVFDQLGWRAGDQLEWLDNKDGTWTIKKTPLQS